MKMAFDQTVSDPDAVLLARYAGGDRHASAELVQRLTPRILGLARRLLQDGAEAEDVTQEAMLRLWRIAPDWDPGRARVSTWLYRVASNLCIDRQRRKKPAELAEDWEVADPTPDVTHVMQGRTRVAALEDALAHLPLRQRQAVVLRHLDGLANPEIAEIMGISVEAVESLSARGKRTLTTLLSGRKEELGFADD
ncbi:RNA polymerase sigma factor [Pseudoruegeria sp. SK021]|uniref:RNA polymerase sigma factor n=1 Tax=Pseudoruegeria sp. SK021 TaxID=1933035 RepID=UPI000A234D0C|nr:RNA polymerase sigma factor [Pseudoruegeria sp. SK021]OSP54350.1 RNA polymerase subunit sigma [Pseudoruegeria sp. SK021]